MSPPLGALILGFVLAIGRLSDHAWVRAPVMGVTEVFRAIPVLVLMILLYYGLPVVGIKMTSYWAVVIALIVYNGSVLAEVVRAGVESLPRGQREAGLAIGLRKAGVMRLILLPQAIRAMMPVIIAQLVVTLKDTALGFIITYPELLYFAKLLGSNAPLGSPLIPAALVAGTIYVALCLALSYVAYVVEKRLRRSPKAVVVAGGEAGVGVGSSRPRRRPRPRPSRRTVPSPSSSATRGSSPRSPRGRCERLPCGFDPGRARDGARPARR